MLNHSKQICSKCKVPKEIEDNFYIRYNGKPSRVCKECTRERMKKRRMDKINGTFVNQVKIVIDKESEEKKKCSCSNIPKAIEHFRPYTKTVKGKVYSYRAKKCRNCEAANMRERNFMTKFKTDSAILNVNEELNWLI